MYDYCALQQSYNALTSSCSSCDHDGKACTLRARSKATLRLLFLTFRIPSLAGLYHYGRSQTSRYWLRQVWMLMWYVETPNYTISS